MPNWVTAKLTVNGDNSEKIIKSLLTKNEDKELNFDFNKIKPMPKELQITSGTTTDRAVELYLTSINPDIDYVGEHKVTRQVLQNITNLTNSLKNFTKFRNDLPKDEIEKLLQKFENDGLSTEKQIIEYGRKAVNNVMKHNAMDWYDWSINNWGTKWNACQTVYDENTPSEICFETAWSDVRGLICELSKKYPENIFNYDYSEEQIGINTGTASFQNGKIIKDIEYLDQSKEAYELAFELWGQDLKEDFKFNEKKNTYEYIDDQNDGEMD